MDNRCFVICDKEQSYADELALLLIRKINFQIHVCSTAEQAAVIAEEKGIDILLIDEAFPEQVREQIRAKETIVLVSADTQEDKQIYKYQSGDAILSEILEISLEGSQTDIVRQKLYRDSCLIGVYSPVHRVGKTAFALALGRKFAKDERVLYLNLETYSGWQNRYSRGEKYTLADLLYYARQENSGLQTRIGIMTGEMEGMEYIAPMKISEDLKRVTLEVWEDLLEQLTSHKMYGKIIIDFGECVQGLWELLGLCQRIYMPVNSDAESQAKLAQFESNAEILGYGEVMEKIRKLELEGSVEEYVEQVLEKEE